MSVISNEFQSILNKPQEIKVSFNHIEISVNGNLLDWGNWSIKAIQFQNPIKNNYREKKFNWIKLKDGL